jgi:anion-transporting  ArsA/GET3 family ATPase
VPSLFDKRLLIFSGKGGAGKSTVAAAAAVAAARRGARVLLVEIGDQERLPAIFRAAPAGYDGRRVYTSPAGNAAPIWSMCLTARDSLHEYAVRSMKFEVLYEAIFENRVMRYFTAAAPGLDDLTIMGKIESLHREKLDPLRNPTFDLMVFDAPATGHGLAFFKVPGMAMRIARVGPLYAKVERMWRLLADPARTALNIVTVPEEMSVSEAIDLHHAAEDIGLPRGKIIVNGVVPDTLLGDAADLRRIRRESRPTDAPDGRIATAVLDSALASVARREAHDEMIGKIARALPQPRVILPFLFSPRMGPEQIETLADHLEGF